MAALPCSASPSAPVRRGATLSFSRRHRQSETGTGRGFTLFFPYSPGPSLGFFLSPQSAGHGRKLQCCIGHSAVPSGENTEMHPPHGELEKNWRTPDLGKRVSAAKLTFLLFLFNRVFDIFWSSHFRFPGRGSAGFCRTWYLRRADRKLADRH